MSVTGSEPAFYDGYKSVFTAPLRTGESVQEVAQTYVRDWLRARSGAADRMALDQWNGLEDLTLLSGTRIESFLYQGGRGEDTAIRYRVTDSGDNGSYRVSFSAFSQVAGRSRRASFIIDVARNFDGEDLAIQEIFPPRLLPLILEQRNVYNGKARLQGSPHTIHADDTHAVVEAIADQERQVAVIIGASPSLEADEKWRQILGRLTKNSVGAASILSVSADAVEALNDELPPALRIPPGHIRTIAPRVVLENPDVRRHPLITPNELLEVLDDTGIPHEAAVEEHAIVPRKYLLDAALPAPLRRLGDLLDKEERRQLLEKQVAAGMDASEAAMGSAPLKLPRRRDLHGSQSDATDFWGWFRPVVASWLEIDLDEVSDTSIETNLRRLDEVIRKDRESLAVHEQYLSDVEKELATVKVELAAVKEDADSLSAQLEAAQAKLKRSILPEQETGDPGDGAALSALQEKVADVAPSEPEAREVTAAGAPHSEEPGVDARAEIEEALGYLASRLDPIIAQTLKPWVGEHHWIDVLRQLDTARGRTPGTYAAQDPAVPLRIITEKLGQIGFPFDSPGDRTVSTLGQELRSLRNKWSHYYDLSDMDAFRAHDQIHRLLTALGDQEGSSWAKSRRDQLAATVWNFVQSEDEDAAEQPVEMASERGAPTSADSPAQNPVRLRRDASETPLIGADRLVFEAWRPSGEEDPDILNQLSSMAAKEQVRSVVEDIVEFEGPIHLPRLLSLVAREFGYRSLHDRRSRAIERQVRHAQVLVDRDKFVWPLDISPEQWREFRPSDPEDDRNFYEVSPVEIRNAARFISESEPGLDASELETRVLQTFGKVRKTSNVLEHLHAALGSSVDGSPA